MDEDSLIVKEVALGSHKAYKILFNKYFPKVKYFITHLIKSETTAEDLAQDVLTKVWEYRSRLTAVESFNSYVYRMAKNAALNYLEHKFVEDAFLATLAGRPPETVDNEWDEKEIRLLEQLTISRMPPQRRKVYEMSRIEGLSNDEISASLCVTKKTVENHLNLALKELRKVLYIITLSF